MSHLKRLKRKLELRGGSKIMQDSGKLLKRMRRDHLDVLQNIEFVLIRNYREDNTINDHIVEVALRAAINRDVPKDDCAQLLNRELETIRQFRSDVSDDIWRDALRTVLQSVHRHSNLKPGSRDYLDFVSDFIL